MRKISNKAVEAEAVSAPAESGETNEFNTTNANQPAAVADTGEAEASQCPPPANHDGSDGHPELSNKPAASAPSEFAGAAAQVTAESAEHASEEPAPSHNSSSGEEAAPSLDTLNMTPSNHEPSPTETALAVIEQANGTYRIPYDSVVAEGVTKGAQWFSEATPELLYALWENGAQAFLMSYRGRCEIVYWLHKKTAKPGCHGGFHDALRRIGLKKTTGYDMVRNHAISIGEAKDEDDSDPRDEEEQQSDATPGAPVVPPKQRAKPAPRVVLVLKDTLAEAIADIQKRYGCPDAKSAVTECVLPVWRGSSASSVPRKDRKQVRGEVAHNPLWLHSLRWLNDAHYDLKVGVDDLQTNCRVIANGQFLCHLIPSALSSHERQEFFRLSLAVARNKALVTRRLKTVGGGQRLQTKAGTPSVDVRPRRLIALRDAKEGFFGFQGAGRGGGFRPCAFNSERPEHYRQLVSHCDTLSLLAHEHEPEISQRQMDLTLARRSRMLGQSIWSQGVCNLCFPMTVHSDSSNVPGSLSAMTVAGDYEGGPLIFPAYRVAVFMRPGDVLLYNGHAHHGVGPFHGVRLSTVLFLNSAVLRCR